MLIETTRIAAAICHGCSQPAISPVSPFSFSGGGFFTIKCMADGCNTECASITLKNKKFKLAVRCPFCGDIHSMSIDEDRLWKKELTVLSCLESGINIFFLGVSTEVYDAIDKSFSQITDMLHDTVFNMCGGYLYEDMPDMSEEEELVYDILDEINELRQSGSLSCVCGSENISVNVIDKTILLSCNRCRRTRRMELSEETLTLLMNATAVIIGK